MPYDKPSAEIHLDEDVVRRLLAEQCPQWAAEPVTFLLAGWDNAMFTVGDGKLARIPRQAVAVELLVNEQRWLPELAPALPLPIPVPVHAGTPTTFYPWPWSVVPLAAGRSGLEVAVAESWSSTGLAGSMPLARSLGEFVAALHAIAVPADPPVNPYRGIPLLERAVWLDDHLAACGDVLAPATVDAARTLWADALAAPPPVAPTWLHGDLHPGNVVVGDGSITDGALSVIDFGDLCTGDPAVDLLLAWQLFDPAAREVFRATSGVDDATWRRGRGWALAHGVACLANSADDPTFTALGRRTVDVLLAYPLP